MQTLDRLWTRLCRALRARPTPSTSTNNQITNNAQWAIFEDTVVEGHGLSEALSNLYMGNDFEENGGAIYPDSLPGQLLFRRTTSSSSACQVVLGVVNGEGGYRAFGPVVRDNYFTTLTGTPYNIEIANADSALIEGNSELVGISRTEELLCQHDRRDPHLDWGERHRPEECVLFQRCSGNSSRR